MNIFNTMKSQYLLFVEEYFEIRPTEMLDLILILSFSHLFFYNTLYTAVNTSIDSPFHHKIRQVLNKNYLSTDL